MSRPVQISESHRKWVTDQPTLVCWVNSPGSTEAWLRNFHQSRPEERGGGLIIYSYGIARWQHCREMSSFSPWRPDRILLAALPVQMVTSLPWHCGSWTRVHSEICHLIGGSPLPSDRKTDVRSFAMRERLSDEGEMENICH